VTKPSVLRTPTPARIALIADTHLIVPDVKSAALFPRRLRAMPLEEQSALYRKVSLEVERAYEACVESIQHADADAIIHLGDVTSGWGRGGMGDASVRDMAERCADDLRRLGKPLYCTLGNHDMGSKVDKEPEAISNAADTYEAIFGPLFWHFMAGDILMLGMCSPLAYYTGNDERLLKRKRDQEAYLADTLNAHPDTRWVLYVHDPLAVQSVIKQVGPHMKRCDRVVVGHFHRPIAGGIVRGLARTPIAPLALRDVNFRRALRKTYVAPSTAPLWYKGYGWVQADIDGSNVDFTRIEAPKPEASEEIPTRSLAWCLSGLAIKDEHFE
jgi:predicted phosphodiesterase